MARQPFDWRRVLITARDAVLALIMPAIILGGMFGGVYTPTEGAAVAVAYALAIGTVVYRTLTRRVDLRGAARVRHGHGCGALRRRRGERAVVDHDRRSELARYSSSVFVPFEGTPGVMLLFIAAITLVLGTAMEETTMLVLMTPVLAPVVAKAGIDPVHFGLVFVLATMIGLITPPVGHHRCSLGARSRACRSTSSRAPCGDRSWPWCARLLSSRSGRAWCCFCRICCSDR